MSAICGVIGLDGRPFTASDLDGVMRALVPLGGDGGGTWSGTAGRCGVALGAALRHATPEDRVDRQPAQGHDGTVLVGDLRLDNRGELAAALGRAATVPDSELVLAAYERWGEAMLERIVGEFALAIVDARRGGVLLARDHFGIRPLALHERSGVVAFASTPLSLTGLEGVGRALDLTRAAEALALVASPGRTFVRGVRWLSPGSAMWIGDAGPREWKWWRPDSSIVDLGSAEAHERELRDALDAAVASRLRSTGQVGASTSGGLDSTSVTATAALLLAPEALRTYTAAPPPGWRGTERPGRDADESPLVLKLAERHRNIRPRFVHLTPDERLFGAQEPLWELGAAPVPHTFNWLWMRELRDRARAEDVSTLLSGSRGNLFFSADGPGWFAALLRAGRARTAWRELSAWAAVTGRSRSRVAASELRRLARPRPAALPGAWLETTLLRPGAVAERDVVERGPFARDPRAWMWQRFAEQADAETAAAALTGVEERDPTSDRRLLEVAMRQPEWVRGRNGVTRAAARGAMADRLPPEIVNRTRHGEQVPDYLDLLMAARGEVVAELEELRSHPASRELLDAGRLERLVREWPAAGTGADPSVERDYRIALPRALVLSRYLRWFEAWAAA